MKFNIEDIRRKVLAGKYEMTLHAKMRMGLRKISTAQIEEALLNGEIIERYDNDKPFPSCLIMGYLNSGFPLYVVCAFNQVLHIVTAHWLDPMKWLDPRTRREKRYE